MRFGAAEDKAAPNTLIALPPMPESIALGSKRALRTADNIWAASRI